MIANINETCSSHMPVLIELLRVFQPRRVREFGAGLFSTQLFARCAEFTSIEAGDGQWFDYLAKRYSDRKWNLKQVSTVAEALAEVVPCDLLFNDGHYRELIAEKAFTCCPVIVCHDSQYDWAVKLAPPAGFYRIDFKHYPVMYKSHEQGVHDDRPWTTIFTSNQEIVRHFDNLETWLYDTYKFPYPDYCDAGL